MAKRGAGRRAASSRATRKTRAARRPSQRTRKKASGRKARSVPKRQSHAIGKKSPLRKRPAEKVAATAKRTRTARRAVPPRPARLDRERRILEDTFPTPPSSLDMDRRGSAARTGRAELQDSLHEHTGMTPALTGGDVDADWENAYFSGDEAPGGDNPTPDQDVVEDIGKALGVEYQDNEELKGSDKVGERDKHRWELDPASSEDYKDRK
jgi:Family of unknown function (DUF6335)